MTNYTGHLIPRETSKGKHYQMVIEGPRDPVTGRRSRRYETLHLSKREAEKLLHQRLADLNRGMAEVKSSKTLGEWLDEWMELYMKGIAPSTASDYRWRIDHYLKPQLGSERLRELDGIMLQRYVNSLTESSEHRSKPLSAKSVRNIVNILSAALKTAQALHLIPYNPCDALHLPKLTKPKTNVLTAEQVRQVMQAASGTDIYLLLILGFMLGLRRGEMAALRWDDFDFDKGVVRISRSRVNAGGQVIEKAPKTSAGLRSIDLGDKLVMVLQEYRDKAAGPFVLSREDGQPYSPDSLTRKFKRFLEKNGLPDIRLHDTRHTNATALCEAGVDPKTAQVRLGHASISTTLGIYVHTTDSLCKQAAEKIDELI